MRALARDADRLGRTCGGTDWHKTNIDNADETQRLAQVRRRHVDASAIHAGDEITAARENDHRWSILEQRKVTTHWIEPERQAGLADHVDPLLELVGNAEVPHRRRDQHTLGQREADRNSFGNRKGVALGIAEATPTDARVFRRQDRTLELRQLIAPEIHLVNVPIGPCLSE